MTYSELLNYCLSKKGAYIDHPFGPESDIIKVEGKIFAQLFVLKGIETATLNCERMTGDFYRQMFPGIIVRGYHCPPVQQPYWNTVYLDRFPEEELPMMVDHAYEAVLGKLTRKEREEIAAKNA